MLLKCGVGEDSWEFLGLQGDQTSQSILKEISPEYSLEGLTLELKLQYFGHLMWRTDSLEKTLILERLKAWGEGDDRGWDGWMASPTWWTWVWAGSGIWWWTGVLPSVQSQAVGHEQATELTDQVKSMSAPIGTRGFSPTPWGYLMTINYLCQQKAVFKFSWKKAEWGLIWFGAFLMSEPKAQSLRKREGVGLSWS